MSTSLHSFKDIEVKQPLKLPVVYFDIEIDDKKIGRIEITLRADVVPKTAENFRQLCLKPQGEGYKGSIIHRIIPNFMCQGGDITNGDGTGGKSIYGSPFPDENFVLKHRGPGILSMANCGRNTNNSQFFICFKEVSRLNDKHVVFGYVTKGLDILNKLEAAGSRDGKTTQKVLIKNCGQLI